MMKINRLKLIVILLTGLLLPLLPVFQSFADVKLDDTGNQTIPGRIKSIDGVNNIILSENNDILKAWDAFSGRLLWQTDPSQKVDNIEISPTGNRLIASFHRDLTRLYDMKTGKVLRTMDTHIDGKSLKTIKMDCTGNYSVMLYSGGYIHSTSKDNILTIRDNTSGALIKTIRGVSVFKIDPNGRYIALGKGSKKGRMVQSGRTIYYSEDKTKTKKSRQSLFGSSPSNEILIYQLNTGERLNVLKGHNDKIRNIIIDKSGRFILASSKAGSATLWDIKLDSWVQSFTIDDTPLNAKVKTDSQQRYAIYQKMNGKKIHVWDLHTGEKIFTIKGEPKSRPLFKGTSGNYLISKTTKKLYVWDMAGRKLQKIINTPYSSKVVVDASKGIIAAGTGKNILIYDLLTGDIKNKLSGHNKNIYYLKTVNNSTISNKTVLVSRDYDGILNVWDPETGKLLRTSNPPREREDSLPRTYVIGNRYIASAVNDNSFIIWNLKNNITIEAGNPGPIIESILNQSFSPVKNIVQKKNGIDNLIADLNSPNGSIRLSARERLLNQGTDDDAIPLIKQYVLKSNPGIQKIMAQVFGQIAGEKTIQFLVKKLSDRNPSVRQFSLMVLTERGDEKIIKSILPLLNDKSNDIRMLAVDYLKKIYMADLAIAYNYILKHGNRNMKKEALYYFETNNDKKVINDLALAMKDKNSEISTLAAESIGKISGDKSFEILRKAAENPSQSVRAGAMAGLSALNTDPALQIVMKGLTDESDYVRSKAVRELAKFKDDRIFPTLISLINDENSMVRRSAAEGLGELGDQRGISFLVKLVANNIERNAAFTALEKIGGDEAVKGLLSTLRNPGTKRGQIFPVIKSILKTQSEGVIEIMIITLKKGNAEQRQAAVGVLGKIKGPKSYDSLARAVRDKNKDVRRMAWDSIKQIGDEQIFEKLVPALAEENTKAWLLIALKAAHRKGMIGYISGVRDVVHCKEKDTLMDYAITQAIDKIATPDHAMKMLLKKYKTETMDTELRKEVVMFMGRVKFKAAAETLANDLGHSDFTIRKYAARSLAQIGDAKANNILRELLKTGSTDKRVAAAWGLSYTKNNKMIKPLIVSLTDKNDKVRYFALRAINELSPDNHNTLMINALDNPYSNIRLEAVRYLGKKRVAAAYTKVNHLSQTDKDKKVRARAKQALVNIKRSYNQR